MMGPLATKVLREVRRSQSNIVSPQSARDVTAFEAALAGKRPELSGMPPNHARWMAIFELLGKGVTALTGLHALRKLGPRIDQAEEEYMPGGPPMSPVLDSVFMMWWMADLPAGPGRETLLGIFAEIAPMLSSPPWLAACARALASSRLGVYRVEELGQQRVRLTELGTGVSVQAAVPDDLKARRSLWLTRLLPPPAGDGSGDFVVWTTPYVLADTEQQWTAYLDRVLSAAKPSERAQKLAQHFKAFDEPKRWLEYVMNGYAGQEHETGAVVLTGMPDQPSTLPHHPDYDESIGAVAADATPL